MKKTFSSISKFLLAFFWIVFPFQFRTLIYTTVWYESGNFNPFTSIFLHASDVVLLGALFFCGVAFWKKELSFSGNFNWKLFFKVFCVLMGLFCISIFMAENKFLAFLLVIRWIEWGILFLLSLKLLPIRSVLQCFIAGMSIEALIAILQFVKQGSLGLSGLGEPVVSSVLPGVAKLDWGGGKLIRSYGTFPHPNILGGALVIAMTGMLFFKNFLLERKEVSRRKSFDHLFKQRTAQTVLFCLCFFLMGMALLFSFSRSAWLAAAIIFMMELFLSLRKKSSWLKNISLKRLAVVVTVFFTLCLFLLLTDVGAIFVHRLNPYSDPNALNERLVFLDASIMMFRLYPLGIGLGHFTFQLPLVADFQLNPWEIQPVHNFWLLLLNEVGIIGCVIMVYFFIKEVEKRIKDLFMKNELSDLRNFVDVKRPLLELGLLSLIGFMVLSFFDHYFFTLYQGQVLLVLVLLMNAHCSRHI